MTPPAPPAPAAINQSVAEEDAAIDALPTYNEPSVTGDHSGKPTAAVVPPPKAPDAPVEPPKAPEPPKKAPTGDIDDLPAEPKIEPPKAAVVAPPSMDPKTPKELRAAYEARGTEAATLKAEAAELRKQIEAAKQAGNDTKALREEMAALTKERTELADKIRYLNYRESAEFNDKYQKPLQSAWEAALADIDGMMIEREDGTSEKVTAQHLTQLLQMPAGQAAGVAAKIFGHAAPEILAHRRAIIGLQKASQSAVEEWKTKGSEMSAAQERAQKEEMVSRQTAFAQGIIDARETMPDVFGRPSDPEAAAFFDKGEKRVRMAFFGDGIEAGLTPQQQTARRVQAQAEVAARAAAFGAQRHMLNKANARVADLEAKLKAYEKSEPTPAPNKPPTPKVDDDDYDAAIDALPTI